MATEIARFVAPAEGPAVDLNTLTQFAVIMTGGGTDEHYTEEKVFDYVCDGHQIARAADHIRVYRKTGR